MARKQFVFLMGRADGQDLKTILVSRSRLFLFSSLFIIVLLFFSYFLGRGLHGVEDNYRLQKVANENRVLKNSFGTWEKRFDEMQVSLDELIKRNRQIRMTAALSSPDVEFGMGGPELSDRPGLTEIPGLQDAELDLARLEVELTWLKTSTTEIESQLETKFKEIAHYPSVRPVKGGWVTSVFGDRIDPFTGIKEMHPGLDIAIRPGSEVLATGAGLVRTVNTKVIKNKGYGKYIVIDHGYGYETLYGHLSEIYVKKGQRVKRWDLIGLTGNTGKSTAPHIHYSVLVKGEYVNPVNFILD